MLSFIFSILFSSSFAWGNVPGVWSLSGVGCRDSDFSPSSHVSKTLTQANFGYIESAIFTINSDQTISFLVREKSGKQRRHTGTYTYQNEILNIQPDDNEDPISLSFISSYLIYVDDTGSRAVCGNKKLVLVFGKTN